jgi:ClpP class serine protease
MVDSYGGEVNGCFDLSDTIFAARGAKPIYGVGNDNAFSAAYAQLAACSKVFVSRTSGVGSVGVVALHVDQSAADKMDGLKYSYVHSGKHKVDGNPHEPLTGPAESAMQKECDRLWKIFAGAVGKYRSMSAVTVMAMEAQCYFGQDAVRAELADAVGTPADA